MCPYCQQLVINGDTKWIQTAFITNTEGQNQWYNQAWYNHQYTSSQKLEHTELYKLFDMYIRELYNKKLKYKRVSLCVTCFAYYIIQSFLCFDDWSFGEQEIIQSGFSFENKKTQEESFVDAETEREQARGVCFPSGW